MNALNNKSQKQLIKNIDIGINSNYEAKDTQKINQNMNYSIPSSGNKGPKDFFKKANIMLILFFNLKNFSLFLQKDVLEPFLQLKIQVIYIILYLIIFSYLSKFILTISKTMILIQVSQ